jgi:2-polyprenyl-3-methyl-5-hydroxy-6-metoxy-1,4-benzoquinol methylase
VLFCTVYDRVLATPETQWEIRRCRECGFGWTHPPLASESIAAYYPDTYIGDASRTADEFISGSLQAGRSWRAETEKVALVQSCLSRGRILDVGCGDARFLLALDSMRWERTGIDFAGERLRVMSGRFPELRLIRGGLELEALESAGYDAVTLWHVLEHLPDPRQALRRAVELLSPGGWIFISLPNVDSLQAALFRNHWYCFDDVPRHLHHFSPPSLERLLGEAGLRLHRRVFFSRRVSFHSLKHSLVHWSEARCGNRAPYYLLKPFLYGFVLSEVLTRRHGIFTIIARK